MAVCLGRLMHEMAITQSIIASVADHCSGRKVSRVVLEVGNLSGVMIDAVLFCFDLAAEGTPLEGARLEVVAIEARAICRSCKNEFIQDSLLRPCRCGSHDIERLSGEELNIRQYELAPDTARFVVSPEHGEQYV